VKHLPAPDTPNSRGLNPVPIVPDTAAAPPRLAAPYYASYQPEPPLDPEAPGLLEYWYLLCRHKGLLLLFAFLGALAAVLVTLPMTPVYQAKLTLEIQSLNENFMGMQNVSPTTESSGWNSEQDIQTQVKILQSASLLEAVTKKLEKDNKPLVVDESRISAWRKALGLAPAPSPDARSSAIEAASEALKVRAQPNTRLIDITVDSISPQVAAEFANALASEFIEQSLDARWKTAQHTGEWLSRQLDDMKIRLEKSEEALQNYARSAGLLFTDEKDNVADERLKQIQQELSAAQAERVSRQSRYELAVSADADTLGEVLDSALLKDYQVRLADARRELAELSSSLTPAHPKVKKAEAQVATLESAASRERSNIVSRIKNDYESALRRERLLAASYDAHARLVTDQADKVTHYNILKREVDTNRQLYDSMLQRVKEAGLASALRASNIRIVDPAEIPERPYKPRLPLNAALGLFLGGFLGVAFIVFRDRADRTVREPGDTTAFLGLPEIGVIPSAGASMPRSRRLLGPAAAADDLELVAWQRKPSAMSESFRAALTSILMMGSNGSRPRVLVLSSPAPQEGKTTVCTNLGISLAAVHRRVLLIDADLRRPRLHQIFDLDNDHGLSQILASPDPIDGPLNAAVLQTHIPNLSVITSGSTDDADPSLLYSGRLPELIAAARAEYDMVLIDTPPMLAMADARIIARHADGVVLVARTGHTTRDALEQAAARLAEDGARVLGAILNDWNPKKSGHYGYYGYYKRYGNYYSSPGVRSNLAE